MAINSIGDFGTIGQTTGVNKEYHRLIEAHEFLTVELGLIVQHRIVVGAYQFLLI